MKKKLIIVGVILIVLIFSLYKYIYKSHRDITSEEAVYSKTVAEVYDAFAANDSLANATYLDKTIEIRGIITNVDLANKMITVDEKLSARFSGKITEDVKLKDSVILKGRLVGFDDLLEEIQLDQCSLE